MLKACTGEYGYQSTGVTRYEQCAMHDVISLLPGTIRIES